LNQRALDYQNTYGIRLLVSGRPSVLDGAGARYSRSERAIIAPLTPLLDQNVRVGSWSHEEVHAQTHALEQRNQARTDGGEIRMNTSQSLSWNSLPSNYSKRFSEDEVRAYATSSHWIVKELLRKAQQNPGNFESEFKRARPALEAHLSALKNLSRTRKEAYRTSESVSAIDLKPESRSGTEGFTFSTQTGFIIWKPGKTAEVLQAISDSVTQVARQASKIEQLRDFDSDLSAAEAYVQLQTADAILQSIISLD